MKITHFGLNTIITFGKYGGDDMSLKDVIEHDPDYAQWMLDTFSEPFDDEVQEYLDNYIAGLDIPPLESDIEFEPEPDDNISILERLKKIAENELNRKKK